MAKIEGEILIGRPVEEVSDFVADSRNEPSFNPAMAGVELLTALPIGPGTRFRARMGRAGMQMLVELTDFGCGQPKRAERDVMRAVLYTSGPRASHPLDGGALCSRPAAPSADPPGTSPGRLVT